MGVCFANLETIKQRRLETIKKHFLMKAGNGKKKRSRLAAGSDQNTLHGKAGNSKILTFGEF